jgi:hypothetical protein
MSYKPDEAVFMAYLYDELTSDEKLMVENYLQENPEARKDLEQLQHLRKMMARVEDKEVIAPPIVMEDRRHRFFSTIPYAKTIMGIAASLLMLMVAGKLLDLQVNYSDSELRLSFGAPVETSTAEQPAHASLSAEDVQRMINESMLQNNQIVQAGWNEAQKKLDESIHKNLALNSGKINSLVQQASNASQNQIRDYVASLQNQNQQLVKDYFQLTTSEQQKYIESLLVDFSKYLQQQRNNDLEVLQTRLMSVEQNASVLKQETEQILASIISNGTTGNTTNKNY